MATSRLRTLLVWFAILGLHAASERRQEFVFAQVDVRLHSIESGFCLLVLYVASDH
jgi:hypothetical protein